MLPAHQRSPAFLQTLGELYAATLRRAEREVVRSLEDEPGGPSDVPRQAGVFTVRARLTERSRKLLKKRLLELGDLVESADDPRGEVTVVTVALHPGSG